jgi:hypothetical protein
MGCWEDFGCVRGGVSVDGLGNRDVPGSTADLGQRQLHAPDLTLVAETIFADSLQLGVTVE